MMLDRSCLAALAGILLAASSGRAATLLGAIESPSGVFTLSVTTDAIFQAIEIGVDGDVANGMNAVPINETFQSRQLVSTTDGFRLLSPLGSSATEGVFEPGLNADIDLTYGVTNPVPGEWIDGFVSMPFLQFDLQSEQALASVRLISSGQTVETATLTLRSGQLVGDFNGDESVDAADYTVWRDSFGSDADLAADANGTGDVDEADRLIWARSYSSTFVGGIAVPEPAAAWIAIIGIGTSAGRSRA